MTGTGLRCGSEGTGESGEILWEAPLLEPLILELTVDYYLPALTVLPHVAPSGIARGSEHTDAIAFVQCPGVPS